MKKITKTVLLVIFVLMLPSVQRSQTVPIAANNNKIKFKVYFLKRNSGETNEKLFAVERSQPKTAKVLDAASRNLFLGPTEDERKQDLTAYFTPETIIPFNENCYGKVKQPLLKYYLGVTVKKGVAIVNFRKRAECYLNSTMTMQYNVKAPIEATIRQFKNIKSWEIAFDGKIFSDWDA